MDWKQTLEVANIVFAGVVCVATVGGVAVAIGWHDPNQREIGRLNALSEFIERLPAHRRPAFEADFDRRVDRLERRLSAAPSTGRYWWIAVITLVACLFEEVLQLVLLGPGEGAVWTMPLLANLAGLGILLMFVVLLLVPVLPQPLGLERWVWLFVPALALVVVEVLRTDSDTQWVASQMTLIGLYTLSRLLVALGVVAAVGYSTLLLVPRTRRWLFSRIRSAGDGTRATTPSVGRSSGGDHES